MNSYKFNEKVWLYHGDSPWYFISLPFDIADEINFLYSHLYRGWRSLRVHVKVGKTEWDTSIFKDSKRNSFLLPIKSEVRNRENIKEGVEINLILEIKQ